MNGNKERKEKKPAKRTNGRKGGAIGIGAEEWIGRDGDTVRERNDGVGERSSNSSNESCNGSISSSNEIDNYSNGSYDGNNSSGIDNDGNNSSTCGNTYDNGSTITDNAGSAINSTISGNDGAAEEKENVKKKKGSINRKRKKIDNESGVEGSGNRNDYDSYLHNNNNDSSSNNNSNNNNNDNSNSSYTNHLTNHTKNKNIITEPVHIEKKSAINDKLYGTTHAAHNALTQAVYTKNVPFFINFTYCDAQSKTEQVAGLAKQCKIDLLLLIFNALKKEIAVELLDLAVLLLRNSTELLYNRKYRRIVEDVVEYLKGYAMGYNKIVYLEGKLSSLKRDRKERKKALVEKNEDEVV